MKDRMISYFTFGNCYYSVELTQDNTNNVFNGIGLKRRKGQVEIMDSFICKEIEEITDHIPKNKPISLVVNNDQIITKKVKSNITENAKLLQQAFPNIKIEEFHYEILKQNSLHFISICRKNFINSLLTELRSKNIYVIDITLGNLGISSIVALMSESQIKTSNAHITKNHDEIMDIQLRHDSSPIVYEFNDVRLDNNQLLNFSAALRLITNTKSLESFFGDTKKKLKVEFGQKLFFSQFLKLGLSFLFLILLINYFIFSHYYNKVNELSETATVLNTAKDRLYDLSEKVTKQEKLFKDIIKGNVSKSSFYTDAIVNSIPLDITLTELNYQPLLKKIKYDKAIALDSNILIISGSSSNSIVVPQWIAQLERMKWINHIEITNFDETKEDTSQFTIKIHIH
ncbi:MAG: hypothetical protein GYB32_13025 [Algicola sp.]|nr:hypothetical protein [Algicola sp.]